MDFDFTYWAGVAAVGCLVGNLAFMATILWMTGRVPPKTEPVPVDRPRPLPKPVQDVWAPWQDVGGEG